MLSVKEVAERFEKNPRTIARWVRKGHFPGARKDGPGKTNRYLIPEKDVKELMEQLRIIPETQATN